MRLFTAPGISLETYVCDTDECDIFNIVVKRKGDYYK